MAYTLGGVGAANRLRAQVRDIAPTEIFSDTEYYRWLSRCLSAEFLAIYYPSSNEAGITSASVQVVLSSANLLVLNLTTNGSTTPITLAPHGEGTVGDLIDRISAVAGWKVGLSSARQHVVTWTDLTIRAWRLAHFRPMLRQMIDGAKVADLAEHRDGTLDALGDLDTYARLHFYEMGAALSLALRGLLGKDGADGNYTSRSKGNSSWTKGAINERLKEVDYQASFGLYAEVG